MTQALNEQRRLPLTINQTRQTQEGPSIVAVRQGKPRNKKYDTKFHFVSHLTLKQILRFRISQLAL